MPFIGHKSNILGLHGDYEGDTCYPKTRYLHHKLTKRPGLGQRKTICYKDRFELYHDAEGYLTRM